MIEPARTPRTAELCRRPRLDSQEFKRHSLAAIEEPSDPAATVETICQLMTTPPTWAEGLPLDADGYQCAFYRKE